MAVDFSKFGGMPGSASSKKMATILKEEVLLHKNDVVLIPNDMGNSNWGKNPQLNDAAFVVCEKHVEGASVDDGYAFYPGAFSRTVIVGTQNGDTFVKKETVDIYTGSFVQEYLRIRKEHPGCTEAEFMTFLAGKKFKVVDVVKHDDEWIKGWEDDPIKPGKRKPSNAWRNAKQGFTTYILDLV